MSNYFIKAKNKLTGKIYVVLCHEGFFDRQNYGYRIEALSDEYMNQKEFDAAFDVIENPLQTDKTESVIHELARTLDYALDVMSLPAKRSMDNPTYETARALATKYKD